MRSTICPSRKNIPACFPCNVHPELLLIKVLELLNKLPSQVGTNIFELKYQLLGEVVLFDSKCNS